MVWWIFIGCGWIIQQIAWPLKIYRIRNKQKTDHTHSLTRSLARLLAHTSSVATSHTQCHHVYALLTHRMCDHDHIVCCPMFLFYGRKNQTAEYSFCVAWYNLLYFTLDFSNWILTYHFSFYSLLLLRQFWWLMISRMNRTNRLTRSLY